MFTRPRQARKRPIQSPPPAAPPPWLAGILRRLEGIDTEALGRASGFIRRKCRKLDVGLLCKALAGLAGMGAPTLELIVQTLGLLGHSTYSAQALCKRVGPGLEAFLLAVIAAVFRRNAGEMPTNGCFAPFRRILVQDSTTVALPDRYASAFPGCVSQSSRTFSQLKLQCVFDLARLGLAQFSFSGFTRNDQTAAPDILAIVRRGDLVLRNLGYFSIHTFESLIEAGVHFLSRLRALVLLCDPESGQPLHLARLLKKGERLDRMVRIDEERLLVRLVALPVPQEVGNRRRLSRRDCRANPSRDRLYLMDWNLFITTVDADVWSLDQVAAAYRLRWTIEIIFKAWKCHLRLEDLNTHSEPMLRLSVVAQLFHCTLMLWCWATLQAGNGRHGHASILRVARIMSGCAALLACMIWRCTPAQLIGGLLARMGRHRRRRDRQNLCEQLAFLCAA